MNIKYHRINESELSSLPFNEGSMYFCKDTGKLYADPIGGGVHTLINDNIDDDEISNSSTWSSNKINGTIKNKANELNQSITTVQNNLNTAKTELSTDYNNKIKNAAPVNLLDNSDFTNPVNQRGETSYTGKPGYTIDRWVNTNSDTITTITDVGLIFSANTKNGYPRQRLSNNHNLKGKVVTGVICLSSGTIVFGSGTVPNNSVSEPTPIIYKAINQNSALGVFLDVDDTIIFQFTVNAGNGISVKWAALYEGEYTAETLPEYRPKGYEIELLHCMHYCQILSRYEAYRAFIISANTVQVTFPLHVPMRIKPSASAFNFEVRNLQSVTSTGFTFSLSNYGNGYIRINASKTGHGLTDASIVVSDPVILSADLDI